MTLLSSIFVVFWPAQCVVLVVLSICAVTDVLYRRISELLLIIAALLILLIHFSLINVCIGILLSIPWLIGAYMGKSGLGDAEMSAIIGLGMGIIGIGPIWLGLLAGLLTKKHWEKLSGPSVLEAERVLAPIGLYYAFGVITFLFVELMFGIK